MDEQDKQLSEKKPLLKRWWAKLMGGVILLTAVFFLLLPVVAKNYLQSWLEDNGAQRATIHSLSYNPFISQLTIEGMELIRDDKTLFKESQIVVNVGLTDLLKKNIRIEKSTYTDLSVDIEIGADGSTRIGTYTIEPSGGEDTEIAGEQQKSSNWAFQADVVEMNNCQFLLKTSELDLRFLVEKALLNRFSTREGHPAATLTLSGAINDRKLKIDLSKLQIRPYTELSGIIEIDGFQLKDIAGVVKDSLDQFSGAFDLTGQIDFSLSDKNGLYVSYDGEIGLGEHLIGSGAFQTKGTLSYEGGVVYSDPEDTPAVIKTEGMLKAKDFSLDLKESEMLIQEGDVQFGGISETVLGENLSFSHNGSLMLRGLKLIMPFFELDEEKLSWKGETKYSSIIEDKSGLKIKGELNGENIVADLVDPSMKVTQSDLTLKIDQNLQFGDVVDIRGISSLSLNGSKVFDKKEQIDLVQIDSITLQDITAKGNQRILLENGSVKGTELQITGTLPLKISVPEVVLSSFSTDDLERYYLARVAVNGPQVVSALTGDVVAESLSISTTGVEATAKGDVRSEIIKMEGLSLIKDDTDKTGAALMLGNGSVEQFSWSGENGLVIDGIDLGSLVIDLLKDKDGNLVLSERLASMQKKQDEEPVSEAGQKDMIADESVGSQSPALPVKIADITVGGDSHFTFEDKSLSVPFATELAISSLRIDDIDSTDPSRRAQFQFSGELEKRAPLDITGSMAPFQEKLDLDMQLKLKNYPLSNLSSYTVQSIGTSLASGQLRLGSDLKLKDDKINLVNKVQLQKLKTETISEELAKELDNQLPIPLDAALSMLRDSKDNIKLEIPVNGPLDDIGVGISDVLITALSKAIVPAASGYLVYTLGPYAALAYVGMKVGEKMLQINLPPIEFEVNDTLLAEDHHDLLNRVGQILQERPDTDLQVCPTVASWEFMTEAEISTIKTDKVEPRENDRERLLQLGQMRASSIKAYLANQHEIGVSRLLICDTKIEKAKGTKPVVNMHL